MTDSEKAVLKKDLIIGVLAHGSIQQKDNALNIANAMYQWCIVHIGQANTAPKDDAKDVRTTAKATRK